MQFIKFLKTYQADIILALAVILISITAFNLGKISVSNQQKRRIQFDRLGAGLHSCPSAHGRFRRAPKLWNVLDLNRRGDRREREKKGNWTQSLEQVL